MSVIRVCFLGTPDFAATHLKAMLEDDHYQIVGVITQPDRPAGRSLKLTPSPVKVLALAHQLNVLTPEKLSTDEAALTQLKEWNAEIGVVVAYGQILKQHVLDLFPLGAVNVHGSLLPKWRGAAPIQRSLEAGDSVTGVALQKMVLKLDAGAVIGERKLQLDEKINSVELYEKLAHMGCELIRLELMDYIKGNLVPIEQDEAEVSVAKKITKEEAKINWGKPALKIHNQVRGFAIGPGSFGFFQSKRIKFHRTFYKTSGTKGNPGETTTVGANSFFISTGDGQLEVLELQPESKPKMTAEQFIKQVSLKTGDRFE